MPISDKEARNTYIAAWKREDRRLKREALGKKKWERAPRTTEQKELSNQQRKEYAKQYNKENPYKSLNRVDTLLWAARRRAKKHNLEFSITKDDIIIPTHCPILNTPLISHAPRGTHRKSVASLDRIDPTKGYTKDNIEVISHLANTMKSDASKEDLLSFSTTMINRYGS